MPTSSPIGSTFSIWFYITIASMFRCRFSEEAIAEEQYVKLLVRVTQQPTPFNQYILKGCLEERRKVCLYLCLYLYIMNVDNFVSSLSHW